MLNALAADLDLVLDHTREAWEELRGARLFITGGTGFFGCWLLESLVWANRTLGVDVSATVLTRNPDAFRKRAPHLAEDLAITLHAGDVCSFDPPEGKFTHVIHGATESSASLNSAQPLTMLDTIVDGTRRTLDFAITSGAKRVLLLSSGAVYGKQLPLVRMVPETYGGAPNASDPLSAYAEGKRMAELLCSIYCRSFGLQPVTARCFAFLGPYMQFDTHFAAGNFIRDALRGHHIVVEGDGTAQRSYLYAADLTAWLWTLLVRGRAGRVYNVGSEQEITIARLAGAVASEFDPQPVVSIRGIARKSATVDRYIPCTARARHELQLAEWTPLDAAIRRTADWARRQGLKCAAATGEAAL